MLSGFFFFFLSLLDSFAVKSHVFTEIYPHTHYKVSYLSFQSIVCFAFTRCSTRLPIDTLQDVSILSPTLRSLIVHTTLKFIAVPSNVPVCSTAMTSPSGSNSASGRDSHPVWMKREVHEQRRRVWMRGRGKEGDETKSFILRMQKRNSSRN
jgi:hypothetical protein